MTDINSQLSDRDHIALFGKAASGKSTLAARYTPEYVVADADGRWGQQKANMGGKCHILAGADILETSKQAKALRRQLAQASGKIGTVIFDSVTSFTDYGGAEGRLAAEAANKAGGKINRNDAHREKADTFRVMRGIVLNFAANSIYIGHYEDRSMDGKARLRRTISNTELRALLMALDVTLQVGTEPSRNMRFLKIEWARYKLDNSSDDPLLCKSPFMGQMLWDVDSQWTGMPERLHSFLRGWTPECGYDGKVYEWERICKALGLTVEKPKDLPQWFDAKAWAPIVADLKAKKEASK